jgi:tryptophanase
MKNKMTLLAGAVLALSLSLTPSVYAKDNYHHDTKSVHQQSKHEQPVKVVKVIHKNESHNKNVQHKHYIAKKVDTKPTPVIKVKANNSPSITILVADNTAHGKVVYKL